MADDFNAIKCNYLECSAGMGVAGRLVCFRGGDYTLPYCPRFQNEEQYLKEWEEEDKKNK